MCGTLSLVLSTPNWDAQKTWEGVYKMQGLEVAHLGLFHVCFLDEVELLKYVDVEILLAPNSGSRTLRSKILRPDLPPDGRNI